VARGALEPAVTFVLAFAAGAACHSLYARLWAQTEQVNRLTESLDTAVTLATEQTQRAAAANEQRIKLDTKLSKSLASIAALRACVLTPELRELRAARFAQIAANSAKSGASEVQK
jgi:hypothetical protein